MACRSYWFFALLGLIVRALAAPQETWCQSKDIVTFHDPPVGGVGVSVVVPPRCRKLGLSRSSSRFGDAGTLALAAQLAMPYDNATGGEAAFVYLR